MGFGGDDSVVRPWEGSEGPFRHGRVGRIWVRNAGRTDRAVVRARVSTASFGLAVGQN
jgi:hypothetical protein